MRFLPYTQCVYPLQCYAFKNWGNFPCGWPRASTTFIICPLQICTLTWGLLSLFGSPSEGQRRCFIYQNRSLWGKTEALEESLLHSLWHCRWSSFLYLFLSQNAREPAHCSVPVSIELEPWEFWFQCTRATQLLHVEMRAVFSFFCRPLFGVANVSVHMKERGDITGTGLSTHNVQPWD